MWLAINHLRRHTVGYVALFVALSGSAYAATALPANSVGTAQVKNHSLLKADFKNGQIPAGKAGSPGARGPAGAFNAGNVSTVAGPMATLCPLGGGDCAIGGSIARCPAGSVPVSGGWAPQSDSPLIAATVVQNGPVGSDGWGVVVVNDTTSLGGAFQAVAICGAVAAGSPARRAPAGLDPLLKTLATRLGTTGVAGR